MKPATPSQALAAILAAECPDEAVGAVLRQCLAATTVSRSGAAEPDLKTRLEAAKLVLGYRHGLPVRREETIAVNLDAESAVGLAHRLRASPALRAALRTALEDADRGSETLDA
jgi:hypothetical protein